MEMIPQVQVLESMRLFAREVMPKFRTSADLNAPVYAPGRSLRAAGSSSGAH
jgi:hypothetical protein